MNLAALCLALAVSDGAELLATASFPGDARDRSGLRGQVGTGPTAVPLDRLGGLGSAIDGLGGDEYLMVSDRGPFDGAVPFPARMHKVRLSVDVPARRATVELLSTTLLRQPNGAPYSGGISDRPRLDAEGARVAPDGTVFVSDEYGPFLLAFDAAGRQTRNIALPAKFLCPRPGRAPSEEMPPHATSGRFPNRGMEGLARTPRGTLVGIMQGPLLQDCQVSVPPAAPGQPPAEPKASGVCCRIVVLADGAAPREHVYVLDAPTDGVSEILAIDETRFLVLERDSAGGVAAKRKRIHLIDLAGATDVADVPALPPEGPPAGVRPVRKESFLDLLDPRHGIAGPRCPAKFEGLAWGPPLADGRRLLIVTVDSDYEASKATALHAFAVRLPAGAEAARASSPPR